MEKFKRVLAGLASILLIFILVGSIISAIVISIPVKAWPVWIGLPLLVYFAFNPILSLVKRMIEYGNGRE